jgi:hypothetical protein
MNWRKKKREEFFEKIKNKNKKNLYFNCFFFFNKSQVISFHKSLRLGLRHAFLSNRHSGN